MTRGKSIEQRILSDELHKNPIKNLKNLDKLRKKMKDNRIEDNDQKLNCFPY